MILKPVFSDKKYTDSIQTREVQIENIDIFPETGFNCIVKNYIPRKDFSVCFFALPDVMKYTFAVQ